MNDPKVELDISDLKRRVTIVEREISEMRAERDAAAEKVKGILAAARSGNPLEMISAMKEL